MVCSGSTRPVSSIDLTISIDGDDTVNVTLPVSSGACGVDDT